MKRLIMGSLLVFLVLHGTAALQWPVSIESMISSFLDGREGSAEPFVEFEGYKSMRPFDTGEVVFRYIPDSYGALQGVGESILILEHENGFQSIYSAITEEELRMDREKLSVGEFLRAPDSDDDTGFLPLHNT